MTITDKKDEGEIELSAAAPSDFLPSTTATALSNVTPLDPALVHLIENVDVFYIQQKLQWKEGMFFLFCWIGTVLFDVPSGLIHCLTCSHLGHLITVSLYLPVQL